MSGLSSNVARTRDRSASLNRSTREPRFLIERRALRLIRSERNFGTKLTSCRLGSRRPWNKSGDEELRQEIEADSEGSCHEQGGVKHFYAERLPRKPYERAESTRCRHDLDGNRD